MIPRKRLDIAWTDLLLGIGYCLKLENHRSIELRLEGEWPQGTASLACLSVRSGCERSRMPYPTSRPPEYTAIAG